MLAARVACACAAGRDRLGGQTEVENLHLAVARHEDVGRFQIAMDDPALVRRGETAADLGGEVDRGAERQRRSRNAVGECAAVEQFACGIGRAIVHADVVDGDDVGMRERGHRARFAVEPIAQFRIGNGGGREDFQGHVAVQSRVARPIDDAHAAGAQALEHAVVTDGAADQGIWFDGGMLLQSPAKDTRELRSVGDRKEF